MEKNILTQMLQEYDSFTRSERKIADYVLEHQKETQYISITDLSAECEVAVSTVSLFCRKLRLAGFNDFKLELARASSSLKSLKPASRSFRQNSDTVDTATSHSALRSVMLMYWVSFWCSST